MDLQCRVAAEGGHYYLDHLPLLGIHIYVRNILYTNHDFCTGSAEAPFSSFICAGDRARLEMDPEMIQSLPPAIRAYDSIILQVSIIKRSYKIQPTSISVSLTLPLNVMIFLNVTEFFLSSYHGLQQVYFYVCVSLTIMCCAYIVFGNDWNGQQSRP